MDPRHEFEVADAVLQGDEVRMALGELLNGVRS